MVIIVLSFLTFNFTYAERDISYLYEEVGKISKVFDTYEVPKGNVVLGDVNSVFLPGEGTTKRGIKLPKCRRELIPVPTGTSTLWKILISFGYIIIAISIYIFFPKHFKVMNDAMNKNVIRTFLFGLAAVILIVVGMMLMMLLWIPLTMGFVGMANAIIFVGGLLAILIGIVGEIAVAYFVGEGISKLFYQATPPLIFLIIGMIILQISEFIPPPIGSLVWFVIAVLGLGSIVITKFGTEFA